MPTDQAAAPYPAESMVPLARSYCRVLRQRGLPLSDFDDAVGEFVAAAFRASKRVTDPTTGKAYMHKAGRRAVARWLKGHNRHRETVVPTGAPGLHGAEPLGEEENPMAPVARTPHPSMGLALSAMRRALAGLSAKERELLAARFERGETFPEIAAGLGVSKQQAEWRVKRLLSKLHKVMSPKPTKGT